jgi:hypothetical protein
MGMAGGLEENIGKYVRGGGVTDWRVCRDCQCMGLLPWPQQRTIFVLYIITSEFP